MKVNYEYDGDEYCVGGPLRSLIDIFKSQAKSRSNCILQIEHKLSQLCLFLFVQLRVAQQRGFIEDVGWLVG